MMIIFYCTRKILSPTGGYGGGGGCCFALVADAMEQAMRHWTGKRGFVCTRVSVFWVDCCASASQCMSPIASYSHRPKIFLYICCHGRLLAPIFSCRPYRYDATLARTDQPTDISNPNSSNINKIQREKKKRKKKKKTTENFLFMNKIFQSK